MTNPMDMINAAGGNYASFPEIGAKASGRVLAFIYDEQYTTYSGEPNPCPVVTVDADGESLLVPLDNGRKRYAVKQALQAANADTIEVGGTFALRYVSDGEAQRGQNPPKMFDAAYKPPAPSGNAGLLDDSPTAQPAADELL